MFKLLLISVLVFQPVFANDESGHTCNGTCAWVGTDMTKVNGLSSGTSQVKITDVDVLSAEVEYTKDLEDACKSTLPAIERRNVLSEVSIMVNLVKFVPEVGFNGLDKVAVDKIAKETKRLTPQYEALLSKLNAHICPQ